MTTTEFWSHECRQAEHWPACEGYYPPGRDTWVCHCPCHDQRRGRNTEGTSST